MTLSEYRTRTGLTLAALGARIGVSHSTVKRWEAGESLPRGRRMIAAILEATDGAVTAADLLGGPRDAGTRPGFAETQAPYAAEARALGLDPEAIAGAALKAAIQAEKKRSWVEENREAIEEHTAWIEKHGVPLAKYRMF